MALKELFFKILAISLPKGRPFWLPEGSLMARLFRAMAATFVPAAAAVESIPGQMTPLTGEFTEEDATAWEKRLWIPLKGDNFSLALRLQIIERTQAFPAGIQGRNAAAYLQFKLREAGFTDATVLQNRFPDGSGGVTPIQPTFVLPTLFYDADTFAQGGDAFYDDRTIVQGGDTIYNRIGTVNITNIVANTILPADGDQFIPVPFSIQELKYSFFVTGGPSVEDILFIPRERESEFRQIILSGKPCESLCFIIGAYT